MNLKSSINCKIIAPNKNPKTIAKLQDRLNHAKYFSWAIGALKMLARLLSAKPVGVLWVGLVNKENMQLSDKSKLKAQALGRKLIG